MEYFFQTTERFYFVMPFYRGGELRKVLKAQRAFPEAIVKFYTVQLVLGIGNIHASEIIHRDLKPENIMLDEEGYIKIIDFGLARYLDRGRLASTKCGTANYMSPEML